MSVFEAPPGEAEWPGEAEQLSEAKWPDSMETYEVEGKAELESPFRSGLTFGDTEAQSDPVVLKTLESPFQEGFEEVSEADHHADVFRELLAELESEQFDEAVARLVDEAAGVHLASGATWSSAEAAPGLAAQELEEWIEPLRQETHRMLDNMAERLGAEELETLREPELEAVFESLAPDTGFLPEAFENFLGGLFNKAKSLVKSAVNIAKRGVSAVGSVVSAPFKFLVEQLLGRLKSLAGALLRGVLQKAVGLLPASVQPIARTLAARLFGEAEAEALTGPELSLGRQFDIHAGSMLLAGSEAEAENIATDVLAEAEQPGSAALSELDHARARLAEQLTQLPPGQSPVAEVEQFLPALLAVRPAIQLGLRLIGRHKVVDFLADKIAGLIKGMVGVDAARALSPPLVDVGLSALGLEAPGEAETLAGEALAATVEETAGRMLELPAEAFEDTLRLEAELQEAFAEAAAHHIPAQHLRPDLPYLETAHGDGVWVLMPRSARPRYRYKKYSRVFVVPVTRQVARSIPTADGGTVETMLLDRGVSSWPANAEVHLYETLPETTHLGHIAQFENEGELPIGETLADLHPLTTEAAAMLVNEPGLGRPPVHSHHHHHDRLPGEYPPSHRDHSPSHRDHRSGVPHRVHSSAAVTPAVAHPAVGPERVRRPLTGGQRYFRLRLPGQTRPAGARPHKRVGVHFSRQPGRWLRVEVRLSEREAQELAELLHRNSLPSVVTMLKHSYERVLPAVVVARLLTPGRAMLGEPASHAHPVGFALQVTEAVTQALTGFIRDRQAALTSAVQHASQGVTLTFTFDRAPAAHAAGPLALPQVTVNPGAGRG